MEQYERDFIDNLSKHYQELTWTTPWDGRYETTFKDYEICVNSSHGSYTVIVIGNAQQWEIDTKVYENDPDNDYTIVHLYNKIRYFYESRDKKSFFETLNSKF